MVNIRICGSNALKLTDENYIINKNNYNKNTFITQDVKRKHKWRLKENYKKFYIGVAECLGLLGIMFCVLLFTFGIGMFL